MRKSDKFVSSESRNRRTQEKTNTIGGDKTPSMREQSGAALPARQVRACLAGFDVGGCGGYGVTLSGFDVVVR